MFFDKRVCHPERSAKHVVEGSRPVFLAFFIALLFAACTDYQDEYEDAFRNLVYAEETDDSSSSIEESSSDIDEESSSSKAKSSSSSEESSSSKAKSSSSLKEESSSSSKAKSSSSSEEGSSSSSSSSVELDSVATLSMLKVFATDPSETEASALLSKDSAGLADSNSFSLAIQAPTAFIKVKPSAKKVAQVKVSVGKNSQVVSPDTDGVYFFETPGQFTILDTTKVEIEVKSEDEESVKKYSLSISSTLPPPTNLKLARNNERTQIIAMFDRAKDSRVDGYVVLRSDRGSDGKQGEDLPDSIENKTRITKDANTYKDFKAFLADSTSNTYVDSVGGGSPYYAYRVYAYHMEGDNMVFSEGTEQHMRSVGRIKVEYRMNDFGGEYCYIAMFGRIDIEGKATLYEGRNNNGTELYSWEGYDWHAGDDSYGETIIYLSDILDQKDRIPNSDKHVSYIGGAGLYLNLEAISDHSEKAEHGIYWPYERMAAVLNGEDSFATGRDGNAPVQNRDIEYIFGMERIVYDSNHSRCDGCGDDPHAGFKFWFKYDWVDDDDIY